MALSGASGARLRVRALGLLQALGHEVGVAELEQDGDVARILPAPLLEMGDVVAGVGVPVLVGVRVRALRRRLVLVDGDGRVSGGQAAACRRVAGRARGLAATGAHAGDDHRGRDGHSDSGGDEGQGSSHTRPSVGGALAGAQAG